MDKSSSHPDVQVSSWNACLNSADGIISLSCAVTSNGGGISAVGLILNSSVGETIASSYVEFSSDCQSVTPAINLPQGALKVGDTVNGVVSGQSNSRHFFFQKALTIGDC